jgi:hypothetical protein
MFYSLCVDSCNGETSCGFIVAAGILTHRHSTFREFEKIGEGMLNPVLEALRSIAEINIESQV